MIGIHNMIKQKLIEKISDSLSFEMIGVEGGSFLMGSNEEEAFKIEQPVHKVQVPDFYLGKYPVTQSLWKAVMGGDNNPSNFQGDNRPVEGVSWKNAHQFLKKLNELTHQTYRLPTESEWEYAARGGKKSQGFKYSGSNKLKDVGWYSKNSYGETKPVGLKYPNELGLYDMSGNVWEWVEDDWHDRYTDAPDDGTARLAADWGTVRVIRGGGWGSEARSCRVSYRLSFEAAERNYDLGFRMALSPSSAG